MQRNEICVFDVPDLVPVSQYGQDRHPSPGSGIIHPLCEWYDR